MLLNRDQIRSRNLIGPINADHLRMTSYDVTVGKVLSPSGEELKRWNLPPQDMVLVVSKESVALPTNVTGYAMPKTQLSNEGVLALSTGIIDPGYKGEVSSILINFGRTNFQLTEGKAFLRLTFHDAPSPSYTIPAPTITDRDRQKIAMKLPNTFLNIEAVHDRVSESVGKQQRDALTNSFGQIGIILAAGALLITIIVFLGAPFVDMYVNGGLVRDDIASQIRSQEVRPLEQRVEELEVRLNAVENESDSGQN